MKLPPLSASQKESQIFPPTTGGAEAMCQALKIPLLGKVPLDPHIGESEHGPEGPLLMHGRLSHSGLVSGAAVVGQGWAHRAP